MCAVRVRDLLLKRASRPRPGRWNAWKSGAEPAACPSVLYVIPPSGLPSREPEEGERARPARSRSRTGRAHWRHADKRWGGARERARGRRGGQCNDALMRSRRLSGDPPGKPMRSERCLKSRGLRKGKREWMTATSEVRHFPLNPLSSLSAPTQHYARRQRFSYLLPPKPSPSAQAFLRPCFLVVLNILRDGGHDHKAAIFVSKQRQFPSARPPTVAK